MRFEGNKKLKESIPHYFKNINQSYIIFELFKYSYYCLLVKGNANNDIEYYKIDNAYRDDFFFREDNGKQSILNFQEVQSNLLTQGINLSEVTSENLYDLVYSESRKSKAVVWVTDKVKRRGRGLNNNFTKIYRYLIKSSEITEETFKHSLIVADSKQDEVLQVFSDRSKDEITELEKKQKKIARLKTIGAEYQQLKLLVDEYNSKRKICSKLKYNFIKKFGVIDKKLSEEISDTSDLSIKINTVTKLIADVLEKDRDNLNRSLGTITGEINTQKDKLKAVETALKEIEPYGEKGTLQYAALENGIRNIGNEFAELLTQLTTITKYNLTEEQVSKKITELTKQKSSIDRNLDNFGHLLYQKISDDKQIRAKLYSLLSREVLEQNEDKIVKQVTKVENILKLFDGSVDVSEIKIKEFETIEELKEKSAQLEEEIRQQEEILLVIKDRKEKQAKLDKLQTKKNQNELLLQKVNNKPKFLQQQEDIKSEIEKLEKSFVDKEGAILDKELEIKDKKNELDRLAKYKNDKKNDLNKYREWFEKINSYKEYFDVEEHTDYDLKKIYEEFENTNKSVNQIKESIWGSQSSKGLFQAVCHKLEKDNSDIFEFIREVDEELATLNQLEKNTAELLELISHKVTKPTYDFLQRYNEFKNFIKSFNRQLEDFPVSNIKDLSIRAKDNDILIPDLKKISNISNMSDLLSFSFEQQESLSVLKSYLEKGSVIKFEQLFDLILEIELHTGKREKIKLSEQVESNATDRVLKLFLFLSIIKELAVNSPENKIAIYIDELGTIGPHNVRQIIKFCNKFNFIPIFAAPREIEGIEKYYIIKPSSKSGGIIIDERHTKIAKYKYADTAIL